MSALLSGVVSLSFLAVQNRNSDNAMVFKREAEAGTRRLPKSSRLRNRPRCSSPSSGTMTTFDSLERKAVLWGEESSSLADLKAAFSLLLTMRGIPQIYSGDEIAMPGGGDPHNRRDFPGGFPGDLRDAFTSSGRTSERQEVFAHVQSLLALRKAPHLAHRQAMAHRLGRN
jgi:hypothetical protein